jgi:hypothetical protein
MTGVEMIAAGREPDKVLRLQWDWDGHPIELASPYGLLSRIVRSREYLAVLEDIDATGYHARLSATGAVLGTEEVHWGAGLKIDSTESIKDYELRGHRHGTLSRELTVPIFVPTLRQNRS